MIDFHVHSLLSDGVLVPSEVVRRAVDKGYRGIAITDHVDHSNLETVLTSLAKVKGPLNRKGDIKVLIGVEITHAPVKEISGLIREARKLGADIVAVHGETIVEPVMPGTNRAAIKGGADILAHPGLVKAQDAQLAARHGVYFELSARKGHCLTNGHVAHMALLHGVKLLVNTDTHTPDDLISVEQAKSIALGAGLDIKQWKQICKNATGLLKKK